MKGGIFFRVYLAGFEYGQQSGYSPYPNPWGGSFIFDTLKLSASWEVLEIFDTDGRKKLANFNIRYKTTVSININHLANGYYTAILRRRNGQPAVIKLLKL